MKKITLKSFLPRLFLVFLVLAPVFSGCAFLGSERGAKAITIAARRGTYEYVKRKPETRLVFEASAAALASLVATNASYDTLVAAIQGLKIREFKGDQGALLLRDALDLLDLTVLDLLREQDMPTLRNVAQALADGIGQGLAQLSAGAKAPPLPPIRESFRLSSDFAARAANISKEAQFAFSLAPGVADISLSGDLVNWTAPISVPWNGGTFTILDYDNQDPAKFYRIAMR